jgi:hypothetical protein
MAKRHASRSERMEDDLNRSSFRESGGLSGWPTPEKAPRTSRADSCGPSQGTSAQPQKAIPVKQGPPKKGNAATVGPIAAQSQEGPAEGSYVDGRGGEAAMTSCTELTMGATRPPESERGGPPPAALSSSQVTDEEADASSEWRYQNHCVSPPGRVHMGTHVAVHAPEFGGTSPDLPSTIDREGASSRTSYNV